VSSWRKFIIFLLPSLLDCGVGLITLSYSQEIPTNTPHLSLGLEMRIVQRADSRSVSPCPTTIPNEVKLSALLARKPTRCWEIDTRDSTSDIDDFLQRPQGVLEYWKDLASNNEKLVQNLDPKETTASPSHRWTIGEQKLNTFVKRIGKYFRACRSNTQQRKDGMPTELELRSRRKAPMRVATLGETIS
jgi:hypothetical protein